jgi:hypothetical protein
MDEAEIAVWAERLDRKVEGPPLHQLVKSSNNYNVTDGLRVPQRHGHGF